MRLHSVYYRIALAERDTAKKLLADIAPLVGTRDDVTESTVKMLEIHLESCEANLKHSSEADDKRAWESLGVVFDRQPNRWAFWTVASLDNGDMEDNAQEFATLGECLEGVEIAMGGPLEGQSSEPV